MIHLDFTTSEAVLPVDFHATTDYSVSHAATIEHAALHENMKDAGPVASKVGGTITSQLIGALFWKGLGYLGDYIDSLNQGGTPNGTDPLGNNY
jgi:hypothetical protein